MTIHSATVGGSRARFAVFLIACVLVSAGLALWLASLLNHRRMDNYVASRKMTTISLMKHMGTIVIGGKVPEAVLTNESNVAVRLDSLVTRRSLLLFIDPECGSCLEQLSNLYEAIEQVDKLDVIVITRSSLPVEGWVDKNRIGAVPLLRDVDGDFHVALNLTAVPFSISVDSTMTIVDAFSGIVKAQELTQFVQK